MFMKERWHRLLADKKLKKRDWRHSVLWSTQNGYNGQKKEVAVSVSLQDSLKRPLHLKYLKRLSFFLVFWTQVRSVRGNYKKIRNSGLLTIKMYAFRAAISKHFDLIQPPPSYRQPLTIQINLYSNKCNPLYSYLYIVYD